MKQKGSTVDSQAETDENAHPNDSPLPIEWLQEEKSDTEDFILVLSKKKARERKKNLKISPTLKKKGQSQESPGLHKGRYRKNSNLPAAKKSKLRKNDNTGIDLKL